MFARLLVPSVLLWWRFTLVSSASVSNPSCTTKQDCDEAWAAPSISDCVNGLCNCTGGSRYVEQNKTCMCPQRFQPGLTGCVPEMRQLGSSCKTQDECSKDLGELTTCVSDKCICVTGAVPVNGHCKKKKYIFASCEYNEECSHMKNSICQQNNCTCEDDYQPTPDHKACVPKLYSLWDYCQYDFQCTEAFGEGSYCRSRCLCKSNYHEVNNNQCVIHRETGEGCTSDSECYDDSDVNVIMMICKSGQCVDPNACNITDCKTNNVAAKKWSSTFVIVTSLVTCMSYVSYS